MTIATQLAGVSAADNFGYLQLPSLAKCVGYHLLGGSQAASVANRVAAGAPLSVTGTGALAYEADCAILNNSGSFVTPYNTQALNRSTIMAVSDFWNDNVGTPSTATPAVDPGSAAIRLMAHGGSYPSYYQSGATTIFRSVANGADDVPSTNPQPTQDYPVYFPDGSIRRGRFKIIGISNDGTTARSYVQSGGRVYPYSLPLATPAPTIADAPLTLVVSNSASAKVRIAAFAHFSAFASDAEMFANMAVIAADVEAAGTIDFSPFVTRLAA